MMLKKFRCLALALALILVTVSCTTFAAVKPVKLVMGSIYPADHYYVEADKYFKNLVEKESKGKILIDYFPGGQLGGTSEMTQATKSGAQQLLFTALPQQFWSKLMVFELPYIYRNETHQKKVADRLSSLIGEKEFATKTGMHILGVRLSSARHLVSRIPVYKLEDIKGLKVRVPENGMYLALWKALGAVPTSIPGPDTYTALATGTVDAAENPFPDIYSWKYHEQIKYCALTGHIMPIYALQINNKCWNTLTSKQRKILTKAAAKSSEYSETLRKESEKKYKNLLAKEGMKFTTPDTAPFREKARTIWGQYGADDLIKKIEAIK
jgi:tripartite ATP-independent transporter DctP family solute receptor